MSDSMLYPVFPGIGVVSAEGDPGSARLVSRIRAAVNRGKIEILNDVGMTEEHETTSITLDGKTGRLEFVSDGKTYRVREPRESDGKWLSKYKISLPTKAIRAFAIQGEIVNPEETLEAFATEDSPYIVGLVYTNGAGRWSRVSEDWLLLSPTDTTFDDLEVFPIDTTRGDEFVDLYDANYVSITDAEQYESADFDEEAEASESEPTSDE